MVKRRKEIRILQEHKCIWYPVGRVQEPVQMGLDAWMTKDNKKKQYPKQRIVAELVKN